jgi:hypothetical protein
MHHVPIPASSAPGVNGLLGVACAHTERETVCPTLATPPCKTRRPRALLGRQACCFQQGPVSAAETAGLPVPWLPASCKLYDACFTNLRACVAGSRSGSGVETRPTVATSHSWADGGGKHQLAEGWGGLPCPCPTKGLQDQSCSRQWRRRSGQWVQVQERRQELASGGGVQCSA